MKKNYTVMFLLLYAAAIMGGLGLSNLFDAAMLVGAGLGTLFLLCATIICRKKAKGIEDTVISSAVSFLAEGMFQSVMERMSQQQPA